MTIISVLGEGENEPRVALSAETAKKFIKLGCEVRILSGAGARSRFTDEEYAEAGAKIAGSVPELLQDADLVLKVRRPTAEELSHIKPGAFVIAVMDPYGDTSEIQAMASANVHAFAMEFMPRITRAQSMDVLSSQSNLAGYKAVINAAATFDQAVPMMMTAAGTVPPAKIFVMGAGVAGLQAIATAKRLGSIVTATDVRPASKEQVESLGGKFIAVENEEFKQAETAGGYAKEMSDDYKQQQAELIAKHVTSQNAIITTALIPGRPAPVLITKEMVESMPNGAVIVDLAAERGGNCELTVPGETVVHGGVTILGELNLAGALSTNASSLYARNLYAFIETMINKENGELDVNWEDEVITGTLLTKDGSIVHPQLEQQSLAS